jgi:hypothetical protein
MTRRVRAWGDEARPRATITRCVPDHQRDITSRVVGIPESLRRVSRSGGSPDLRNGIRRVIQSQKFLEVFACFSTSVFIAA